MLDGEIVEINSKNIESARLLASTLSSPQIRKRGFIDILGIFLAKGYFDLKGMKADVSRSLFKIAPLFEEFKITDIYYNNYRIDVITLYKEKAVKIPKIHVDMDILPDYYFVLQVGSKVKEAKMIGFISQRTIFSSPCDSRFYYPDLQDIFDIDRFSTITKIMAPSRLTPSKHKETMELFLKFMDNELPSVYKKQLIKHLLNCPKCAQQFIETMEFEKLANSVSKYPSLVEKYKNKTLIQSFQENNTLTNTIQKGLTDLQIEAQNSKDIFKEEPVRDLNKKRNNISFDRKVDDYGFDDIEYKTSSSDIPSNVPVIDDDYGIIEQDTTDKKDDFKEIQNEQEKPIYNVDNNIVKEYIKDVIQKTIKETIEENLKDAVLDETTKIAQDSDIKFSNEVEKKVQNEPKKEEKEPSILDGYKKPKIAEIIEPKPRKIEIIDFKPDEQLQKAKQEVIENRKIELIDLTKKDTNQAQNRDIKSIKKENKINLTNKNKKIDKLKNAKIKPQEIMFSTPAGEQLQEIVKSEVIEEIFDEENKLDLTVNRKRNGKRLLIASTLMFVILFLIGFIALNGSNEIKNKNNEVQSMNDYDAFEDDDFDDSTISYNQASDGQNKPATVDDFMIKQPLPSQSYAPNISKISWEAPESLVKKQEFTKFLQSIGKNIKLNLQNELLLVNDIPINRVIKADIKITPSGDVTGVNIVSSSGSTKIDNTVKKVVLDTVKYIKPPSLGLRVQNSIITLTVDLN